ncbi:histidine--tRNA ligase [Thiospirochaeta perfilievii]|uniref:Histidine--tRNA ligase n=1 Tax=Thiospirochaeta perfilievii TaxID=252967 RepID=A0A5C1QG11_9SPIO|nr:histidine--tRNA ligase [Thiospirochaeta perfilievii]QEN06080.1 histidine--tRNA ligase [Thiospirochaeta perfilievii]
MSSIIKPRVLKGFRDFLPENEIERKSVIKKLENIFENFGFVPIDTPALEYTEVLLGKGGGETDKQVYNFQDSGKRDVALRFDLTVPFARYISQHLDELYLPFKRYHIAKVWRGENTQRGRYREFTQCDFDIVGVDSPSSDFEIMLMMQSSLFKLGVNDVTIRFSHRGIFNRMLETLCLKDKTVEVLRVVDKLGKIGEVKVVELLEELTTTENALKILEFIKPGKNFRDTLDKMIFLSGGESDDTKRLEEIYSYIIDNKIEKSFILDPSITRGLDYYTGLVYETFLNELPEIGSVCSGGRYNNLASLYTKTELPGVGASIGLDRLLAGLEVLGKKSELKSLTQVLILVLDDKIIGHYHKIATELRKNGINVEVFPIKKKIQQQFKYADNKTIPYLIFCGEDEVASNTINLKDLNTKDNYEGISISKAIDIILE